MRNSGLPHHCYSADLIERGRVIEKFKPDIGQLLVDNSDHFFVNAKEVYFIGHNEAIRIAQEAGRENDLEKLKDAYAHDAYACHFLEDLFAAGHIRNQRGALELFFINTLNCSKSIAKAFAGLLTAAQHERDGNEGLNVSSEENGCWRVYGDGCFFSPKNSGNKAKVVQATQRSIDEVYQAYRNPNLPFVSQMQSFIPTATSCNPKPLYNVSNNSLVLNNSGREIEIDSIPNYLLHGIPLALKYLPKTYIDGYFVKLIASVCPEMSDVLLNTLEVVGQIIFPPIERITSSIWHTVGIATYSQVREQSERTRETVDELADIASSTHRNTEKILKEVENIQAQLEDLRHENRFSPITQAVAAIRDAAYQNREYGANAPRRYENEAASRAWEAHISLGRIFSGRSIIESYRSFLSQRGNLTDKEKTLRATLWFRKMLDFQVEAFGLAFLMGGVEEDFAHPHLMIDNFQRLIARQVEENAGLIDKKLIFESESYIQQQIDILQLESVFKIQARNLIRG